MAYSYSLACFSNIHHWWLFQMHFLMFGSGFQTWEYSPKYAIRSYAYLLLHTVPGKLQIQVFEANKVSFLSVQHFLYAFKWARKTVSDSVGTWGSGMLEDFSDCKRKTEKVLFSAWKSNNHWLGFFASDNLVKHDSYGNVLLWLSTYNCLIFKLPTLKFQLAA